MSLEAQLRAHIAESGLVTPSELARASDAALAAHVRLDQALRELGLLSEERLAALLQPVFGIETVSADEFPDHAVGTSLQPIYLATKQVLPLSLDDKTIVLGMVDPFDDFTAKAIGLKLNRNVIRRRISREDFESAHERLYGSLPSASREAEREKDVLHSDADVTALRDSASDAPVVRFVQETIRAAVAEGASDIHLKPLPHGAEMFFRIDGRLERRRAPEPALYASVISRTKILANLDIAERRLPQDGKLAVTVAGETVDVRVSTMAHVHGEGAVLRLLSRQLVRTSLGDLGFSPHIEAGLQRLMAMSEGLIVVTGPTGSGKSTTLHALLQQLVRPDLNIVTVEDPVEYRVDGISQIQVDEKVGLTFPKILRSLLRQDPDIILIGEIRDAETASIAVQAALTGHLVLATLHTNSALAAVPRLIDMGVEPYLLAAVTKGVLAQRLMRRRCTEGAGGPRADIRLVQSHAAGELHDPHCPRCGGSGYAGRVAVGELALLDSELVEALAVSLTLPRDLELRLQRSGFVPMREDAAARMRAGEIVADDLAAVA